jgi:hypothetical protein
VDCHTAKSRKVLILLDFLMFSKPVEKSTKYKIMRHKIVALRENSGKNPFSTGFCGKVQK